MKQCTRRMHYVADFINIPEIVIVLCPFTVCPFERQPTMEFLIQLNIFAISQSTIEFITHFMAKYVHSN